MFSLEFLYRPNLALLTDLYQLTMAQGYWKTAKTQASTGTVAEPERAVFHLFFRKMPFASGYAVACGTGYLRDLARRLEFAPDDLDYLERQTGNDGRPMFEPGFLAFLSDLRLTCDIDAIPEGTAVFGLEPLLRVEGPIIECQLLETFLLNVINFQTLIATKAARVCTAAKGTPVLEFGLRRAQGIDGALAASRAAYVGGCAATSNVMAGKLFGIPIRGTHAHSWVMSFDSEPEAFEAYAEAMPNNCVFLVDTYDTLEGVRNAIAAGRRLRERGHEMIGIRLDSGDLAYLSIEARKLLDEAGFPKAVIVASNDLDEQTIASLKEQDAPIGVFGVGTKLVTGYDQPALGGVYKLGAIRDPATGQWQPRIKVSEQPIKTTTPGVLQVRRFTKDGRFVGDMIFDQCAGEPQLAGGSVIIDPRDPTRSKGIDADAAHEDLLVPLFRQGRWVARDVPLEHVRQRTANQLASLHPSTRRLLNPHEYPVGLEPGLHQAKMDLIAGTRASTQKLATHMNLNQGVKI